MEFPAIIFLLAYLAVVFILSIFVIFNIYHVVRYAFKTRASIAVTILFVLGLVIIMSVSIYYIAQIDWSQSFSFSII